MVRLTDRSCPVCYKGGRWLWRVIAWYLVRASASCGFGEGSGIGASASKTKGTHWRTTGWPGKRRGKLRCRLGGGGHLPEPPVVAFGIRGRQSTHTASPGASQDSSRHWRMCESLRMFVIPTHHFGTLNLARRAGISYKFPGLAPSARCVWRSDGGLIT